MPKGKLILISTPLSEVDPSSVIPISDLNTIESIRHFVVENVRTSRRLLKKINRDFPVDDCQFFILNKSTDESEIISMLKPAMNGETIGLMSEAGAPAIADPGALLVNKAHEKNIEVIPLTGPSSILMALMSSGLNGQQFTFNGYLPIKSDERKRKIKQLESLASKSGTTQIFIETPYRNHQLMDDLLSTCGPGTKLCVAVDIQGGHQKIKTQRISEWKKSAIKFHKVPAVFLIL